jgi:hypothetical protein
VHDLFKEVTLRVVAGHTAKIVLIVALALLAARLGGRLAGRSIRSIGARSPLR